MRKRIGTWAEISTSFAHGLGTEPMLVLCLSRQQQKGIIAGPASSALRYPPQLVSGVQQMDH